MEMRLMLVDDHSIFLEGLQYLLGTYGIEVAGTAGNGREAVMKARVLKPDIILMDIKMPELSGLDALKLIKAEMPDIKVVMLTTSEEDEDLFNAVKCGASGYLLKNTNAKELVDMLTDMEKGEAAFSPELASKVLKEFESYDNDKASQQEPENMSKTKLTERQLEVLELVAKGVTYKEVGDKLGLTERTVKYHMAKILELLHLENRAQVIAYAARVGLIEK
ncbi:MAG TPA: response regulator transcription factor [Bacillota bacterium]|nr:response regulator transcription factor [Bacillota bacterium]HQE67080.1 response regulator transcription factor [Bacillota bacterium]HQI15980.1 response regulator transcription factor [Bacillota bacterium]HQJ36689.1 response regulator transcription factor [Bacillota bacterium]HRU42873.1 response regulator transcription factor [Candidatus Diapherotrites archaeon]